MEGFILSFIFRWIAIKSFTSFWLNKNSLVDCYISEEQNQVLSPAKHPQTRIWVLTIPIIVFLSLMHFIPRWVCPRIKYFPLLIFILSCCSLLALLPFFCVFFSCTLCFYFYFLDVVLSLDRVIFRPFWFWFWQPFLGQWIHINYFLLCVPSPALWRRLHFDQAWIVTFWSHKQLSYDINYRHILKITNIIFICYLIECIICTISFSCNVFGTIVCSWVLHPSFSCI